MITEQRRIEITDNLQASANRLAAAFDKLALAMDSLFGALVEFSLSQTNEHNGVEWSIIPDAACMSVVEKSDCPFGAPNCAFEFVRQGSNKHDICARIPFYQLGPGRHGTCRTSGLLRIAGYHHVVTTSGCTRIHPASQPSYQLDNALFAKAAVPMCNIVGSRVPGPDGLCHVEVQLLAYVFRRHTKFALAPEFQDSTVLHEFGEGTDLAEALGSYAKLKKSRIVTYLTREPCESCKKIISKFKQTTGMSVRVYVFGYLQNLEPWRPKTIPRQLVSDDDDEDNKDKNDGED